MFKNFLAFYGVMRLLDDVGKSSPPDSNDSAASCLGGCGCLVLLLVAILISCAGC